MSAPTVHWPGPAEVGEAAGVACVDVPPELWRASVTAARDAGYVFFDWLSAVDETDREPAGFDVLTHLAALDPLRRILLRTRVPAGTPLDSVTAVFAGAAWHERETWEMFGVVFADFEDGTGLGLRPLLLPDGFEGAPLRKSFMLAARAAKPWPGAKDPGGSASPSRRRTTPPAVPDAAWGPRRPGDLTPPAEPAPPARAARAPRTRRTPPPREVDGD